METTDEIQIGASFEHDRIRLKPMWSTQHLNQCLFFKTNEEILNIKENQSICLFCVLHSNVCQFQMMKSIITVAIKFISKKSRYLSMGDVTAELKQIKLSKVH